MSFSIMHFLAIFCLLSLTVSAPCKLRNSGEDDSEKVKRSAESQLSEVNQDVNIPDIMFQCNESFRITFGALQEFNNSGSLPDESDRTAMLQSSRISKEFPGELVNGANRGFHKLRVFDECFENKCYMRCFLEKAFILNDGIINKSKVTDIIWPATGNSIEVCQAEGDEEPRPCQKAYVIWKCMMTRALVDAKNKKVE